MTDASFTSEKILTEGKTKKIIASPDPGLVFMESKDDITAGDGAKHNIIEGKAALANRTTCNVFRLLKDCGIPVAFHHQSSLISFVAFLCQMLPFEVVVRREAHGSYLKRAPGLSKGHLFPKLVVEFFLKTSGKKWGELEIPCDDPLMVYGGNVEKSYGEWSLYLPNKPVTAQEPFMVLPYHINNKVFSSSEKASETFDAMAKIACQTFLVLEKAWQLIGRKLVDFKVEFGLDQDGNLLLADVIDNDSWRVVEDGTYIDKQAYRDGGSLNEVTAKYVKVADLTDRFGLPRQSIILWRGSMHDNAEDFAKAFNSFAGSGCDLKSVICSMHKEPVRGMTLLHQLAQDNPDLVLIAYVDLFNGAGPMLSANTHLPVITVPANLELMVDVWSSPRIPSDVRVMTVLKPAKAILAAVEILAMRNPRLYALVRGAKEEHLVNTIRI